MAVGESFTVPLPEAGGPALISVRNMACQYFRRYRLKFRVSCTANRNGWVVTRIAAP